MAVIEEGSSTHSSKKEQVNAKVQLNPMLIAGCQVRERMKKEGFLAVDKVESDTVWVYERV